MDRIPVSDKATNHVASLPSSQWKWGVSWPKGRKVTTSYTPIDASGLSMLSGADILPPLMRISRPPGSPAESLSVAALMLKGSPVLLLPPHR